MKTKLFNALSLAVIMAMLVSSLALADAATNQSININNGAASTTSTDVSVNVSVLHCPPGGDMQALEVAFRNSTSDLWTVVHAANTPWPGPDTDGCNAGVAAPASFAWSLVSGVGGTRTVYARFKHSNDEVFAQDDINYAPITNTHPSLTVPSNITAEATSAYGAAVNYSVTATDTEDDPDPTPSCSPASGSTFPLGATTVNCSVTDSGGLLASGSFTVTVQDTTGPALSLPSSITAEATGSSGAVVSYTASATDKVDGAVAVSCSPATGSTFALGTTPVDCSAADAHSNTTNGSFNVIVQDTTAPVVTVIPDRGPDMNGWYNAPVVFDTAGVDTVSGALDSTCTADQTYTGPDGTGLTVSGSCTDNAGNVGTGTSAAFDFDDTDPLISVALDRSPAGNGWFNVTTGAPVAQFTCSDTTSLIDSCPVDYTFPEGTNQSHSGMAYDNAGNSASASVDSVSVDLSAPTITFVTRTPANGSGWNNGDVTVEWSCYDTGSGVAAASVFKTVSVEGFNQAVTGTCEDLAGNSASDTVSGINIDKSAPTFVSGSVLPNPVTLNGSATATATWNGDISGIASQSCDTVDTSSIGTHTVTCTATDNAGNTATHGLSYGVIYNWNGFFQPVDNLPTFNKAKAGSAIPVKFSLNGNQGLNIFFAGFPASGPTTCNTQTPGDPIEVTVTAGGSSLSYDATTDQYIYVWKTDKLWAGTCRTLTVKLVDGTIHQANFNFTK